MTITATEQRTAAPTRLTVDPDESSVEFAVKSFWGLVTVRGRFDRFDGRYETGPDGTTIGLTIDADSLDTGNGTRDKHLRSGGFFNIAEHPQVRHKTHFRTHGLRPAGTGRREGESGSIVSSPAERRVSGSPGLLSPHLGRQSRESSFAASAHSWPRLR
jgi:YceI-like protein